MLLSFKELLILTNDEKWWDNCHVRLIKTKDGKISRLLKIKMPIGLAKSLQGIPPFMSLIKD